MLQFDMCLVEIQIELAKREWLLESAQNHLKATPDCPIAKQEVRAKQGNVDMWKDYIDLLYPK